VAINRSEARKLCTHAEFALYQTSLPTHINRLAPARLERNVERVRGLRDKFRDLAKSQSRRVQKTGRARGAADDANARTARKAELFGEVLDRLVARREELEARARKQAAAAAKAAEAKAKKAASKAGAARAGGGAKKKARPAPAAAVGSMEPRSSPKARRGGLAGAKSRGKIAKLGHNARSKRAAVRSAGRQNQARRDRR
jgi:hypothetical protein